MEEKKLNKEQKLAVEHGDGPLLIIAGAGTGKTTVVTERIKHLVLSGRCRAEEVLALTFTEKSSREMEERVDIAMPLGMTQMWISTFHSFCDRILRQEGLHIGLDTDYKLMSTTENVGLLKSHLFDFDLKYFRPLGNPTKFIDGLLQHFSRLQDEDILPKEYFRWVKGKRVKDESEEERLELEKWQELSKAYKTYEDIKTKGSLLDYGDLINKTLQLFRDRPNVLKNYQQKFKYLLVDEFQDTNFVQSQLVYLLAGKQANITVVGDDDQSIYRFRGAAISNILQFREKYPQAKTAVLTRNYRSYQSILDKAYELIKHNNPDRLEVAENVNKKLLSQRKKQNSEIKFIHEDRVENEAESVAKEIERLVNNGKYNYKDCVVLVRANNHAESFVKVFQRLGIPHQFLGPGRVFKQQEVLDLIAYLKVLYNPFDSLSMYHLLSLEYFRIENLSIIKLSQQAKTQNTTLFETCQQSDDEKIRKIVEYIEAKLKEIKDKTAGQLLFEFLEDFELLPKLLNVDDPEAEKKAKNISRFFEKLKTFESEHENSGVQSVVDWIELASAVGEAPLATDSDWTEAEAVNVMTLHSAKGLEFPVVFLVNLVAERFPSRHRGEQIPIPDELIKEVLPKGDSHLQEERRLFYVGMTRACDKLYLTAANFYGEAKREKKLSPFIFEALGEEAFVSEKNITTQPEQLSFLDYSTSPKRLTTNYTLPTIHIDSLSYSQIETFRTCPMHFKLKYIYKIPTPQTGAQSFGTSIHSALKSFFEKVGDGEKPTKRLMFKVLRNNWLISGYLDKRHQEEAFEMAKKYLHGYFEAEFNENKLPLMLEQPFTINLPKLKLVGVIDRIDQKANGKYEIMDYKTGANIPSQREVDNNLQLTIYALALVDMFKVDPRDIKLTLYYFEAQQKLSTTRTKAQLERAKEEILKIKEEIEKSDFKCSNDYFCQNCEYSIMCQSNN